MYSSIYTSSKVFDKISKIAALNYECDFDDIGMIWPGKESVNGSDEMCFYVFDHHLEMIGTVYRHEVRSYANSKSETDN
ncbi:hypothetical protein LX73_2298 [Fodinibius salinus]|uniref:Uncharacterized protein n=1 Tax=Fodinibius salinus TaxID=860790 RepID=A0A5D3YJZ4_9BACT|nr:hypothetical protein [Fodinibius salinus]TYP92052.1 hypothetical protein LX73_2298 [Fodinibius salinus]